MVRLYTPPEETPDPAALRQEWIAWLAGSDRPVPHNLLSQLISLHNSQLLPTWAALDRYPGPLTDLVLLDLNYDGRPELLLCDGVGTIAVFSDDHAGGWQRLAQTRLPAAAGTYVGIEVEHRRGGKSAIIVTHNSAGEELLYELFLNPPQELILRRQPQTGSPADQRRLSIARRFGPAGPGLLSASASESHDTRQLALRVTPAFANSVQIPLTYRPVALVHTATTVWIAESRQRISSWLWAENGLQPTPTWPETGLPVPGQITALSLWPDPEQPDQWLLLVATDDRYLLACDTFGQVRFRLTLPSVFTALAPYIDQTESGGWPQLLATDESGRLAAFTPLRSGLVDQPLPELRAVLAELPAARQVELLHQWKSGPPRKQEAALALWVEKAAVGNAEALEQLMLLGAGANPDEAAGLIARVLANLEPHLLAASDSQQFVVSTYLELANSWYDRRSPQLHRVMNRLTAQLAAHFGPEMRERPAYRRLSESRREGELSKALTYREKGREAADPDEAIALLGASLNYFGRILLRRREAVWTFATTTGIRAVAPLAGGQRVLLATQAGHLHQLNLDGRHHEAGYDLGPDNSPRALSTGPLESEIHASIVVLTAAGELAIGRAGEPELLATLAQRLAVAQDLHCLTIIPFRPGEPPRFLAGGHAGLVQLYAQSANGRWRESQSFRVAAEWLTALRVSQLDDNAEPVILAGGRRDGGRGILFRLSLSGVVEQEPLLFPGAIRDIRTIAQLNTPERLVAVICEDGYLYVMKANGARLWQYRIGLSVRSFAIHDIDNNGQPEIIVGGEDNTVLILDVNGSVHWMIPVQAPITHIAVTELEPGQVQLLIADMEHTLQVVQVNPPDSQQEGRLFQEAEQSLDLMARRLEISSLDLIRQWLTAAPTPFLRGYAFHQCANLILDGYPDLLDLLLAVDIRGDHEETQRAYARALVKTATRSGQEKGLVRRIVARLDELLQIPATQHSVGVAAFRKLMQPDLLRPVDLELWQPALLRAAAHKQAGVQRSVLYALRALQPVDSSQRNLRPEAWQILRTILNTPSDGDSWVKEDMAGLIRDIARVPENLWTLLHHTLRELPEAGLLPILGQTQPQMLDSRQLPLAIAALNDLHQAATPAAAGQALNDLAGVFLAIDFYDDAAISADSQMLSTGMHVLGIVEADDLISIYEALIDGLLIGTPAEWLTYVTAPVTEQSLERLGRLLATTRLFGNRYLEGRFGQINESIQKLFKTGKHRPEDLLHLIGVLRREADLLVNIGGNRANESRNGQDTMLAKAVAGLIWSWIQPEGLLTRWYADLTRPAEPEIQVIGARLQRQEIGLTLTVRNPSPSEAIDELSLYIDQATVYLANLELPCQAEAQTEAEGLSLEAGQNQQLRLLITLDPDQVEALKEAPVSKAILQLPYSYFRPPRDWPSVTYEADFDVHITATANLDWENELPRAWSRISRELSEQIQLARTDAPLFVTCPPIGRENLVEVVRQMATVTPNPPLIDLRQWLFAVYDIQREGLTVGEATWLAWLAQQIWPEARRRQIQQIRYEGAPRHFFEALAQSEQENSPELIILNNWESLLFNLARGHTSWEPLDRTLGFLLDWAEQRAVQLVMVGSSLAERILRVRYPGVARRCTVIHCDRPNIEDTEGWDELIDTFDRLLSEVGLLGQLRRFDPPISSRELVTLCGGYLHLLDQLVIPALRALRRAPSLRPEPALSFLLDFAKQSNYFNALWLWQDFYERLTLILVTHGEIPLQDRSWAEDGLTLSRDYFARTSDRRLVRQATLPQGTRLSHREVVTIRANRFFQAGDAHVRGLSPQRPAVPEWGIAGEMFLQLLRAGGGDRRLRELVARGLVRQRGSSYLGDFYELAVPLYDAWIRDSGIWEQMGAAAQSAQNSWYPARLAHDRRPDTPQPRPLLFPERQPGPAYHDINMADLQAIQWALNSKTLPFFLNFYGLSGRAVVDVQTRWGALVDLAQALTGWSEKSHNEIGGDDAKTLFASLRRLFRFEYRDGSGRVHLHALPAAAKELIAAAYVDLHASSTVLRKQVMLLVIRDGARHADHFKDLHSWARDWLESIQQQDVSEREGDQAYQLAELARVMKRSVVVAVTLQGAAELRRTRRQTGGGPHFVIVDVPKLTELVIQPAPAEALISYALDVTGRSAFTPYRLRGALRGGSNLFVGRDTELNAILGSVDSEDHAILGSRRIGKTSLLANLYHRLTQPEFGRDILALRINLLDSSTVSTFYAEIRRELEGRGLSKQARQLEGPPREDYSDLLEVMRQLRAEYQHPTVLLVDEIDGLYLRDRDENDERFFQFLRNRLAQAQPRLCTFIMTGFRYIYLSRLEHSSVFYNFCRFHSLLGIDRAAVALLVDLLEGFKIEIEQKQEVLGLIERGTYAIPYFVQLVCDQLLEFVDQTRRNVIGPDDVRVALARDIQKLLKQELWDSLNVGGTLWGTADSELKRIKTKLALLSLILAKYDHKLDPERAHIALAPEKRTFTAADTVRFLRDWAADVCPSVWPVTENEVNQLFLSLTMTLAMAPAEEDRWAYVFPNDILPDVLCFHQRGDQNFDLLSELNELMEKLKREM